MRQPAQVVGDVGILRQAFQGGLIGIEGGDDLAGFLVADGQDVPGQAAVGVDLERRLGVASA